MTAQRSVVVRVLLASARWAQAQTPILPPGDSITGSSGRGRAWLCNGLQTAGFLTIGRGSGAAADAMPWFAPSNIRYSE